jgi:phosphoribosylformylglycinamidine cyclo-ligase
MSEYVEEDEMFRTFNMGVGMIIATAEENVDFIIKNSDAYEIGKIQKGQKGVKLK